MPAYLIFKFDVVDEARFDRYVAAVMPLLSKHGGKVLVADRAARPLEGPPPGMNVVIEFPSEADARAFYDDPEYQPVKAVRLDSTANRNAVLSSGFVRGS